MDRRKFLESAALGGVGLTSLAASGSWEGRALAPAASGAASGVAFEDPRGYAFSREPLAEVPYAKLPLGSVEPKGWLREQLQRMADGMGGQLDELYSNVSSENAWVGGHGDNWERGPYWIDGLVPLAYTLNDEALIEKANRWMEWSLDSQEASGYFGPDPNKTYKDAPEGKHGAFVQTGNAGDWWPRMVMLKALRSYYEATGEERVIDFMTDYFRYQLQTLPEKPLDHWTWWSKMRGGENQESIYWLYNRTGDDFLLELAPLVFEQTANWTDGLAKEAPPSRHGVNIAMGLKQPALNYLQARDPASLEAIRHGLDFLMREHGQPQGMFSGDEPLHGTDPTHGTELCTVVELMYSLQALARITGRVDHMDHLEKVAFNALPTQHTDDYMGRQYFQQPNQSRISRGPKNFQTGPSGIRICYGLTNGYPCCTTNMHQGWPKYARNLWMATRDGGLAALFYGESAVDAQVGDGVEVHFEEMTNYPFDDTVRFEFGSSEDVAFPLHLRIPDWVDGQASIRVNGNPHATPESGQIAKVDRTWKNGDVVTLKLPMAIRSRRGHEDAANIERGPLVYALRIREDWEKLDEDDYDPSWEEEYTVPTWKVDPEDPWNYGLILDRRNPGENLTVVEEDAAGDAYPWNLENVPVKLAARGKRLPQWEEYHEGAGPLPPSPVRSGEPTEDIELVPYGATTLRVAELPVIRP